MIWLGKGNPVTYDKIYVGGGILEQINKYNYYTGFVLEELRRMFGDIEDITV